jgi:hypothetical protein
MSAVVAGVGWAAAACALAAIAVLRVSAVRRMALVAEAAHELRGPLSAALLGLHGVVADAPGARRVAAVELELRRAGLALADLDCAPRGRRVPELAEPLDARALLAEAVEAWRPLAGVLAADLLFDAPGARLLVHADRLRLTQAVGNLVLNALEHGAGPVRVRAHATRTHVHRGSRPRPRAARAGGDVRERRAPRRPSRAWPRDRGARRRAPRRSVADGAGQRGRLRRARAPARGPERADRTAGPRATPRTSRRAAAARSAGGPMTSAGAAGSSARVCDARAVVP